MYNLLISNYIEKLKSAVSAIPVESVNDLIETLEDARISGRQVFLMGNGGSASTAEHMACDLTNTINNISHRFDAISLVSNTPKLLAIANDYSYEDIFIEQIRGKIKPGTILIGISGSGKSKNLIKAAEYASTHGAKVISFTGFDGGKLKQMSDLSIHINVNNMQVAEDIHLSINHMLVYVLMASYESRKSKAFMSETVNISALAVS